MIPQGGGYQHTSNVFPSGGRGDVKEAAASIDAARTDDVRRNPTDAHQRRPLRGRSSAYPQAAPPLPFLRGCSANSSGGRAAGHPRPLPRSAPADTCFLLTTAHFFRGCAWEALRHRRFFTKRFPGFPSARVCLQAFPLRHPANSIPWRHLPQGLLPSRVPPEFELDEPRATNFTTSPRQVASQRANR